MKILVKYPGEVAKEVEVPQHRDCREYKKLIGCGTFGGVTYPIIRDVYIGCDDNYKLLSGITNKNFVMPEYNDILCGTAVFIGIVHNEYGEQDFGSLTDEQIKQIRDYLLINDCI
jgi:hypothetical protein